MTGLLPEAADLERRFGGLARLYGPAGAQRIRQAHAVVIGLGGVGSWAAEALARSGVARLTLIDLDHISESNINRQLHAPFTVDAVFIGALVGNRRKKTGDQITMTKVQLNRVKSCCIRPSRC